MKEFVIKKLSNQKNPIDLIVVGLGFMGFGFISYLRFIPDIRVTVLITRRVKESAKYLKQKGFKIKIIDSANKISYYANKGYICVSDNLEIINRFENQVVVEMTGSIGYATDVALRTLTSKKHLITMNSELEATVGSELLKIANDNSVLITDVIGDQPGSLARMINESKLMGFNVLIAGNIKRYMDKHATNEKMAPWAKDKGLSVTQTTSFTDGTKQALEMTLVANYFQMNLIKNGMEGPKIGKIQEALTSFDFRKIPRGGVVDYVIGKQLFPGIFLVVDHKDKNQHKYLRYLSLGEGPQYILFEPYHLCHLEILETILGVIFFKDITINNGIKPVAQTVATAKFDLKMGKVLKGIGGDDVYGQISFADDAKDFLPIGLTENAILNRDLKQDELIKKDDVNIENNSASKLLGYF